MPTRTIPYGLIIQDREPVDARFAYSGRPWTNPHIIASSGNSATHIAYEGLLAVDTSDDPGTLWVLNDLTRAAEAAGWSEVLSGSSTQISVGRDFTLVNRGHQSPIGWEPINRELSLLIENQSEATEIFEFISGSTITTGRSYYIAGTGFRASTDFVFGSETITIQASDVSVIELELHNRSTAFNSPALGILRITFDSGTSQTFLDSLQDLENNTEVNQNDYPFSVTGIDTSAAGQLA